MNAALQQFKAIFAAMQHFFYSPCPGAVTAA